MRTSILSLIIVFSVLFAFCITGVALLAWNGSGKWALERPDIRREVKPLVYDPSTIFAKSDDESEADEMGNETGDKSVYTSWGRIGDVELFSPFAHLDITTLLAVSIGAMPEDIVRDGLPWFGATRDDFKGKPRKHKGLDFYLDAEPIHVMADGKVIVRKTRANAGNYVIVDHGDGVHTLYMHLKSPYTGPDDIRQGDILGITGTSGNAISPQLHLGIKIDGVYIDPMIPLKGAASYETMVLIDYYESLYSIKSEARAYLVDAYLTTDSERRKALTERAKSLLTTIETDE